MSDTSLKHSTSITTDGSAQRLSAHGLFVILTATGLALLATPLASPAMPDIARAFAGLAQTEPFARAVLASIQFLPGEPSAIFLVKFVLLSVPALFIIIGAPIAGWMSDNWGRKRLLNASLLIFGLAGVSGYFAESFLFLFAGRAVLGLSIAGIKTASVAMVGDYYEGDERQKVLSWQGSATKVGGFAFMFLGGYLANFSWQVPFLGYALAFLLLPSALLAFGERLPKDATSSPKTVEAGAIPFWPCAFVFVSATLASGLFFVTPVQLPFYLTSVFDASPLQSGIAVGVGNTVGAIVALAYYRFKQRLDYPAIYAVIFLSMSAGYYVLTLMPTYATSLIAMIIGGVGFGLYIPNHSSWILAVVGKERRGYGAGLVTTAMFLGQFLAPIIAEPMIDSDNPAAVWSRVSGVLLCLGVFYSVVAKQGYGRTAKSVARQTP
ncbi:MAG: MFS transporter [Gammaproteobacteria bacterium]|nr:MFS transporter [Gammaproteobacteria bacterium]